MGEVRVVQRRVYRRVDGKWAWQLRTDNGKVIATDGSQGYRTAADAERMADRIIGGEFKDARRTTDPVA